MISALNLCEILSPRLLAEHPVEHIIARATQDEPGSVDRIHLGSSFCSQFFLNTSPFWEPVFEYAEDAHIPITLTVPIFSQKDLPASKDRLREVLENDVVDEVTVNDFGSLDFVINTFDRPVNLGRLFFKDPRDIRFPDYYHSHTSPSWSAHLHAFEHVTCIELDRISEDYALPTGSGVSIALHHPYTYMTTGNICKFASINKDLTHKFRPNDPCSLECTRIHEFYVESFEDDLESELFRFGRSVYYLNESTITAEPDRLIYFPLKELAMWN